MGFIGIAPLSTSLGISVATIPFSCPGGSLCCGSFSFRSWLLLLSLTDTLLCMHSLAVGGCCGWGGRCGDDGRKLLVRLVQGRLPLLFLLLPFSL